MRDPKPSLAVTAVRVGLYLAALVVVLAVVAGGLVLWGFHRSGQRADARAAADARAGGQQADAEAVIRSRADAFVDRLAAGLDAGPVDVRSVAGSDVDLVAVRSGAGSADVFFDASQPFGPHPGPALVELCFDAVLSLTAPHTTGLTEVDCDTPQDDPTAVAILTPVG